MNPRLNIGLSLYRRLANAYLMSFVWSTEKAWTA